LGFMGKKWDSSGVAFDPETWKAVLRVMRPGAYMLAFGGTRTHHRIWCAIEDAGFAIRDTAMWLFGEGFPKGLNLEKACGEEWSGWNTQLKPAYEPIVIAQKPVVGSITANVKAHGVGGLNVAACRIAANPNDRWANAEKAGTLDVDLDKKLLGGNSGFAGYTNGRTLIPPEGRFPTNVLLDEEAARMLDRQAGWLHSGHRPNCGGKEYGDSVKRGATTYGYYSSCIGSTGYADEGGASRYFYVGKVSKSERGDGNDHPTVKPLDLMSYLAKLVTPTGGVVLDPFAGSGSTLLACKRLDFDYVGIEQHAPYVEIIQRRLAAMPDSLFKAA
jgi:hypothetical protein